MEKNIILLILLLPTIAMAAPFCAVNGGGSTCAYYDVNSCQLAAGPGGACVANQNEVLSSPNLSNEVTAPANVGQKPSLKFIDKNILLDTMNSNAQKEQENAKRLLEIEQRRRDLDRSDIEAPTPPSAAPSTSDVAHDGRLVLVCNLRDSGRSQNEEVTFTIDLVNKTVNGNSARISDNAIEWEFYNSENKENVHTNINRLTGSLSGEAGRFFIRGKCAVFSQANRKF